METVRFLPTWLDGDEQAQLITAAQQEHNWETGRQGSGYAKADLLGRKDTTSIVERALDELGNPDVWDAWLLRYPTGSEIPTHTDTVDQGLVHIRFNCIVKAGGGGMLKLAGVETPLNERDAYIFRPDVTEHSVTPIEVNERLVFSVGTVIKEEDGIDV